MSKELNECETFFGKCIINDGLERREIKTKRGAQNGGLKLYNKTTVCGCERTQRSRPLICFASRALGTETWYPH
jgi:hypothetical protein